MGGGATHSGRRVVVLCILLSECRSPTLRLVLEACASKNLLSYLGTGNSSIELTACKIQGLHGAQEDG